MVTTAQVWALIAALISLLVTLITVGVGSLRQQISQQTEAMDHRFDDLRSELSVHFAEVDRRFDRLDGVVQALTNKVFREG